MPHRPRVLHFDVTVDRAGDARSALGGSALPREVEWWAEHLVLAGLVRCTLASMDYSARRAGLNSMGVGSAHGTVTKREDGLYAFVAIETALEVDIAPAPEPAAPPRARREGRARVLRLELPDSEAPASLDRQRPGGPVSTTALDITSVRARFSALDRRLAFFDGPGGAQCPDEVIDAISHYLREDNANIGAPYETSIRTVELVDLAHEKAATFLGCSPGETAFGQSMTAMNFLLTRAFARTLQPGDEIVYTALDHDANVSPWLEIAHDIGHHGSRGRPDRVFGTRLRRPRTAADGSHASGCLPGCGELRRYRSGRSARSWNSLTPRALWRGRTPCITRPTEQ